MQIGRLRVAQYFANLSDNATLAEGEIRLRDATEQKTWRSRLLRPEGEKELVAKLEGIVGSEFVHMDYREAIEVLGRAIEKFEFPVNWGIDLPSGGRAISDRKIRE